MAPCTASCYRTLGENKVSKLVHSMTTRFGKSYYYCSIHRAYHCIGHFRHGLGQPVCCECAWIFFSIPSDAIPLSNLDIPLPGPATKGARSPPVSLSDSDNVEAIDPQGDAIMRGSDEAARAPPGSFGIRHCDLVDCGSPAVALKHRQPDSEPMQAVELMDRDGDAIMMGSRYPAASVPVQLRIARDDAPLDMIPYDDPWFLDLQCQVSFATNPLHYVYYTDHTGRKAMQPAVAELHQAQAYFAPLNRERGDWLLKRVREWSCWMQGGLEPLEPEICWSLTVIFDFCNVMLARQKAWHRAFPKACSEDTNMFWESRYYLQGLVANVEAMARHFRVPGMKGPEVDWAR